MIGWPELMTYGPLVCGGSVLAAIALLVVVIRKRR